MKVMQAFYVFSLDTAHCLRQIVDGSWNRNTISQLYNSIKLVFNKRLLKCNQEFKENVFFDIFFITFKNPHTT